MKIFFKLGLISLLFFLSSCAAVIPRPPSDEVIPRPPLDKETAGIQLVPRDEWPALDDDLEYKDLKAAIAQNLAYLKKRPSEQSFFLGNRMVSTEDQIAGLTLFLKILEEEPDRMSREIQLKRQFDLYRVVQNYQTLPFLMTGYYEPVLKGSRIPSPRFQYPVYRLPGDLLYINTGIFSSKIPGQKWVGRIRGNQVIPYFTRQEIDQEGRLAGKNLELVWVEDHLKLFFLHIQGSGEVVLDDGKVIKIGYHGANGHPYFPLGRELVRKGLFQPEDISLQTIYTYLREHPQEQQTLMNLNPSYIFFKEVVGGPYGSLGRPLTPGRSVAMDLKIFPPGGLAWVKGTQPYINNIGKIQSLRPLERWVCIQDSGGAIKGYSRMDLFLGKGTEAELVAGHLRHPGTVYFLIKKSN